MRIALVLTWLVMVAVSTLGVCAMSAAFTPLCLAVCGVFMALFFCPIAFWPIDERDWS